MQGHRVGFLLLEGDTVGKGDRNAGLKVEQMLFEVQVLGNS